MADSSKMSILLCLFTLLFSVQIHGRESQFFNKIPSNNVAPLSAQIQPNHVDPTLTKPTPEQEPTFIPENENGGYGLYGHQSDQISPTTTTTANNDPNGFLPKYLPKNYNTVAYVTQPEGYTQTKATTNNYGDAAAYVKDQSQSYSASSGNGGGDIDTSYYYPTNYNANGYNSQPQQQSVDQFKLGQKSNFNTNPDTSNYYNSNSNVEKQGMSDTRFMENGRYFYDINSEGNSNRYPFDFENTRTYSSNNNGGYNSRTFGDQYLNNNNNNNGNSYDLNAFPNQGRFEGQDEEQFQDFQNQRALP